MAEQRRAIGRARLAQLLKKDHKPEGLSSAEISGAEASSHKQDVPGTSNVPQRKSFGRGDFMAQLKAQRLLDRQERAEVAQSSSNKSCVEEYSDVTNISKNLSEMKVSEEKEYTEPDYSEVCKQGSYGEQKIFSTNYMRLKTDPDRRVVEYEIKFQPDVVNISYRFSLVYKQFYEIRDMLCYDGGSKLFTTGKITENVIEYSLKHPNDETNVIMTVTFKKIARARDCAALYNTLFKNFARILSMTRFKNKYYDHRAAVKIPQHKLEIWPGVVTSVEDFDGGVQLRCDISHKILRNETAYEIITSIINRRQQNFKALVEKELLGECVSTRYNNNLYRIDDIEWDKTPMSSFELSNGESITFLEYYKKQYNIDIRDAKQPLLISRRKNERGQKSRLVCLVPELCNITGLTDRMCSDYKVMKDIALYTRVTPVQRAYAFTKFLNNIKSNEEIQEILRNWGLIIDDEPVRVEGRNLLPERIIFGKDVTVSAGNGEWNNLFREVMVYRSVDLSNWCVLFIKGDVRLAMSFKNSLRKVGPGLGIAISEPKMITLMDDRNESYINALRDNINRKVQIVVCICPTAREDRYSVIKKFCCKEVPIPSQVVNSITLTREDRLRAVVQNVALQMNAKLGGASWAVHVPFKNTMICGVDTYHDKGTGSTVGGFVASCSQTYTEWFSRTAFQGPKEEMVKDLIQSFRLALKYYYEKFSHYPERIVIYRDGLGDGQLQMCLDFEVIQFRKAYEEIIPEFKPKFTFVVVRKRIATKIFQMTENDPNNVVNPRTGDIVDQTITKKYFYDFYLVSQLVRTSTANPSHYIVLYDNSNMKPDHVQRLTYKFCHLYYNWPGTISVPAPCFYAHKLAYLVGQCVRTNPDRSLENKLYYL